MTVCVDYLTYVLLIQINFEFSLAKLLSFIAGTVFAYFLNKKVTFKAKGNKAANISDWDVSFKKPFTVSMLS